jgi:signal transduction histidine kinase
MVVTDHGIGIARERLPFIFDRFERAVSARQYGGLGLGLYIARSIVTAHGGNIDVDSIAGQRTSFTVSLPRGVASSRSART